MVGIKLMLEKLLKFLVSVPMERIIRTVVPAVFGVLVAIGLNVDSQAGVAVWTGILSTGWATAVNLLENFVHSAFGWLSGLSRLYAAKKREALGVRDKVLELI